MKYNFDAVLNRRNTGSLKWDVKLNELPMWVADMDFKTAPEIVAALNERVQQGIYGYTSPDEEWAESYISFWQDRYGFSIQKDWLVFSLGVVPTISSSVRKLTEEGDNVVVLPPVYNIFYNSILNNRRKVLEVPLINNDDTYSIDFSGLEKAFKEEKTKLCIFCSPANPVGRIWTKEELEKVGELAYKYHVTILADEIHSPLTAPGISYIPFASVNEINKEVSLTAISPTKAFNLAGIQTSAIVIPNEELRKKVVRQINTDEVAEPNVFACLAAKTAFNQGREWLDQLRDYLFSNREKAAAFIKEEMPEFKVVLGQATYLLWVDIRGLTSDSKAFCAFLREKTGLYVNEGDEYGTGGKGYFRMNLACPQATLVEGLLRLKNGVELFKTEYK